MDFKDAMKILSERVLKLKDNVKTEEATKTAFVMPFITALGYDVFNPFEVVPELVADVGIKQGEKIDYAIMKNGDPIILIECKCHTSQLSVNNASQLYRYFHTTKAKFSILTNGIEYKFYTDLDETNKMDTKPFFTFNITEIKEAQLDELKKFHKAYFDFDAITNTASDLKYTNELKVLLGTELNNPSPEFVKHFAKQIYPGNMITQKVLDQFTGLVKKSFQNYLSEIITERLKSALSKESAENRVSSESQEEEISENPKIVTTEEEMEAFLVIKSILRKQVAVDRIAYRDAQSYFAILLDDNNRKTICRLYLGATKKSIGFLDANKKETKFEFSSLDDLFGFSDRLLSAVKLYDSDKVENVVA